MSAIVPSIAPEATGAGVVVAVVDSGVNFNHPHIRARPRGFAVERQEGELVVVPGAHADRYGHGTCCAALVRWLAPGAELLAIRVSAERPSTDAERLARGIELAVEEGAKVLVVPMGTRTVLPSLGRAVELAASRGAIVVAPYPAPGVLPGDHPAAIGVVLADGYDAVLAEARVGADGHPRPAEGARANFYGPSMAAARVGAALARHAETLGGRIDGAGFKSLLPVR